MPLCIVTCEVVFELFESWLELMCFENNQAIIHYYDC